MSIIFSALLALSAQETAAADAPPAPAPVEAPVPEKIPATVDDESVPRVNIRTNEAGDVVEEYRQGALLTMVKITPKGGKPYYIMDSNGDGLINREDALVAGGIVPVNWIIAEW